MIQCPAPAGIKLCPLNPQNRPPAGVMTQRLKIILLDENPSLRQRAVEAFRAGGLEADLLCADCQDDALRNLARQANQRLSFLAAASNVLAGSLDYEATLAAVAQLAVPRIADWVAVHITGEDRSLRRLALAHADPAKVELAKQLELRYPTRPDSPHGIPNVIRTGKSELHTQVTDQLLQQAARDAEHLLILREMNLQSVMIVPLQVRGRTLGGMTFISTDPNRLYSTEDLDLVQDLAGRAAVAIDNARLHKALGDSEERFRFSCESMPQMLFTAQGDGAIDYVNSRWLQYTGLKHEQTTGDGWLTCIHPDDLPQTTLRWRQSRGTGRRFDMEFRLRRSDGVYRWFLVRSLPMRNDQRQIVRWFGTCTDIDDQKITEQELTRAKESAEAANAAKDRFLAVLSHELRTPLTPVLSTVNFLESQPDLNPDLKSAIDMIRRNVQLEARLIDDLLDLTRISRGKLKLHLETIDVHTCFAGAIDICRDEVCDKNLTLKIDLSAPHHIVHADGARLQQVFWNLIKNAVKFTPAGGVIHIHTANSDADLIVRITDTGIGIEPDFLHRVFDAFEQGEATVTRRFGGLGLGLAISRALINAHHGTLVANSPGRNLGTTFTIRIPTLREAPTPSPKPDSSSPAAIPANLRILLVDDHEDTARAMKRLLEHLGYQVQTANSCNSALHTAAAAPFDLLISDIGLPDGSGHDLMRQLLRRPGQTIKGVALSGFGMEQDIRKSKAAGFADHLTKPVNFSQLEKVIRDLVTTS